MVSFHRACMESTKKTIARIHNSSSLPIFITLTTNKVATTNRTNHCTLLFQSYLAKGGFISSNMFDKLIIPCTYPLNVSAYCPIVLHFHNSFIWLHYQSSFLHECDKFFQMYCSAPIAKSNLNWL